MVGSFKLVKVRGLIQCSFAATIRGSFVDFLQKRHYVAFTVFDPSLSNNQSVEDFHGEDGKCSVSNVEADET